MGYSRKEEIAKLRQQRREAKASKKRKENVREKLVRFLIVLNLDKVDSVIFRWKLRIHSANECLQHSMLLVPLPSTSG